MNIIDYKAGCWVTKADEAAACRPAPGWFQYGARLYTLDYRAVLCASLPVTTAAFAAAKEARAVAEASGAKDPSTDFLKPALDAWRSRDDEPLAGYQKAGISRLFHSKFCILGDDVGLGKTAQALVAARLAGNEWDDGWRVLVVAPKATLIGWQREAWKWVHTWLPVLEPGAVLPALGPVLVSWSQVVLRYKELMACPWKVLILDEGHYAKNPEAQRSVATLGQWVLGARGWVRRGQGLCDVTERLWVLSGTPIPNHVIDLRCLLAAGSFVDSSVAVLRLARDWRKFANRYCALRSYRKRVGKRQILTWDDRGHSNEEELNRVLRATVLVRRRKEDVLDDLPPVVRQVITLSSDGMPCPPRGWEDILGDLHAVKLNVAIEKLSKYRHELGLAKVPAVVDVVRDFLEEAAAGKLVVFCYHRDVAEALADALGARYIHGGMKTADRQERVDAFKESVDRVLVATIGAAGTGVNGLQHAAQTCLFAELDWTPGLVSQAIGRLHRRGQKGSVLAMFVFVDADVEHHLLNLLVDKETTAEQVLDGRPASQ